MVWVFFILSIALSGDALSTTRDENLLFLEEEVERFTQTAERLLPSGERLTVRIESLNPQINAEIRKELSGPVIEILGGMLGHPRMTAHTMAMLLCHELGHYLGGPPLKSRAGWSSTEGQADYYSGLVCAKILGLNESELIEGVTNLTAIYSDVSNEPSPQSESTDTRRVTRTNYGYPPAQCRLDTILAGWRDERRPSCWFFE